MTPEHLTNEELANWMVPFTAIDDRSSGYIKSVIDEAARRLRNSIPKPVVQLVSGPSSGGYTYSINGREFWTDLDGCDAEFWGAIGLEGGGDE